MGAREDIELLDSKVARLKVEYEQYFMKLIKREPTKLRDEVERLVLFYSNKNLTNTSLKFKFNSIVAKYNAYKQYWTRSLRAIEEGTYIRKAEAADTGLSSPKAQATVPAKSKDNGTGGPEGKDSELLDVYKKYIDARKECNEPTEGITYETLAKTVEQTRKKVEELYNTKDIELKVYIKDGKTKLAITPKGK